MSMSGEEKGKGETKFKDKVQQEPKVGSRTIIKMFDEIMSQQVIGEHRECQALLSLLDNITKQEGYFLKPALRVIASFGQYGWKISTYYILDIAPLEEKAVLEYLF